MPARTINADRMAVTAALKGVEIDGDVQVNLERWLNCTLPISYRVYQRGEKIAVVAREEWLARLPEGIKDALIELWNAEGSDEQGEFAAHRERIATAKARLATAVEQWS